jgi:L-ascorbate metabolism protein UlaG (beta-lactamase superfamily)
MARFDDRATQPSRGLRHILKWRLWDPLFGSASPRPDDDDFRAPTRETPPDALAAPGLVWIGHATFALRLGGQVILTDPIFSSRIGGVVPRAVPPGMPFEALPPVDVVTISHNHMDHFDVPTLTRLGSRPLYVAPLGHEELLRKIGAERIVLLDWWESHRIGDLTLTLVPARHWSMRAPWTRNEMLWGGFVLSGPEGTAYHSGDTAYFDGFTEIGRRLGPIDWAMLPIGAYEPRWFMEPQHANPEDTGQAFLDLGARHLVAMHWGTFRLTDEPMAEPPERIRAFFRDRGLDPARLWLLDVGEHRGF